MESTAKITPRSARHALPARAPAPTAHMQHDSVRCLVDAMDMALRNGDLRATRSVARECMDLIDIHCTRLLGRSG